MITRPRPGFWMIALLMCNLNFPMASADANTDTNNSAEPACRKEAPTGSRIPVRVCKGDDASVQSLWMSDQIIRPMDLGYVLSTGFPGLVVRMGSLSGVNQRQ